MHPRTTTRAKSTIRLLLRLGAAPVLLFAAVAGTVADQPTPPASASDRDAFLAGTGKDCPGCHLREAKLKRRDLSGADLTGADLSGAVLHRAKLANARLDHAKLQDANLNKADLKRASLTD